MPIEFNVDPYNDDFDANNGPRENNYMRILFKPGYAVQARELTQLQTTIQNQIKLFGDHIFKDGTQVLGGHLTFDNSIISLRLESQFANADIDLSEFNGKLITNNLGVSQKKAKVIAIDETQEFKTIMIRYIRGGEFNNGDEIKVVPGNDPKAKLIASGSANVGSVISINEGVFYVNGFFVNVPEQTLVLDAYNRSPTYRVGLEIQETIVDDSADSTLLDPAQSSFNYQAPGADRYQFSLILSKRTFDSIDDSSFFELLRVEDGIITKQVKYPVYSEIEKTLARRTYDESGNYTVYPFRASASENSSDSDYFNVDIEPGKAYVKGFEFETVGKTSIPVYKARGSSHIETVSDYDLSLEFGNYITVRNLLSGNNGFFNVGSFANVDFHIVPASEIDTTSEATYRTTLAGSARVRSVQRNDLDRFDLFILDESMSKNTFTLTAGSTSPDAFTFPSNYPATAGVYDGVSFTITSGTGAGQSRRITEYSTGGSSRIAKIDRNFDVLPTTSSVITLNYAISDVDSIVVKPTIFGGDVFGNQDSTKAIFPSMNVDSYSKSSTGETFLSRTGFNKLIYPLPEAYIVKSEFSDIDFYHRKYITPVEFNAGGVPGKAVISTVSTGAIETFFYGTDGQFLSASDALEHILVIVKDKKNSAYANGQVLNLTSDGTNGAYRQTDQTIDIIAGNQAFTAEVFINVKVNDVLSSFGNPYVKEKVVAGEFTQSIGQVNYGSASTTVTGQTGTKIDTVNGVVWYTNYSDIVKTPGVKQSLFLSDVIRINKIYDSGNKLYIPNTTNAIDITNRYLFDSGQKDNYYDHGSIILKDGQSPPSGQTAVLLTYFQHTGSDGFFTRDSYSDTSVANNLVGVYSSSSAGVTSLLDVIDFRPRRADATTAFTLTGLRLPYTDLSMELSYAYYIPRIDKLAVTSNKEFKVISGLPSKYPKPPADVQDTMTIYTMFIPPYTNRASDVKFKFHENRRYTMRDIGRIEKRVERLEYYTQLSLLEQQAKDETYFYENRTTEKEKYGILVEQFDGFNIADNKNPDLLCHISFNSLKPFKKITPVELEFTSATGGYKLNGKTYSLTYTETEAISQNVATKAITVQPYLFGSFDGTVQLRPEIDYWVSETLLPEIVTSDPITNEVPPAVVPPTAIPNPPVVVINSGPPTPAAPAPLPDPEPPNEPPPSIAWPPMPPAPPISIDPPPPITPEPTPVVLPTTINVFGTEVVLNPSGWDTTVFTPPPVPDTPTVTTITDTVIAPPQIDLGIFPVTPIGDLSGLSQWSLFVSDLLTTSTPAVEVVEPPPRTPRGGQSGGFRQQGPRSTGSGGRTRRA